MFSPRRRMEIRAGSRVPRPRPTSSTRSSASLLPGVPNGFVQTYLAGVEGIDKAIKEAQANPTGGAPDISGITAPDDTTLVIKLDRHERRSA